MLLTTCTWENGKYESFRMIPVSLEAPYTEVFYDPTARVLVILSKDKKEHFTLLQKIDKFGRGLTEKDKGQAKEILERQRVQTYKEYYVDRPSEISQLIQLVAFNADTFGFEKYLNEPVVLQSDETYDKSNQLATADLS
jgi:hypothetical protein